LVKLTPARQLGWATALCLVGTTLVRADPWAAPGDLALRNDLQLLADAGIVRTPVTSWPVSWGDVRRDVQATDVRWQARSNVAAALRRVQREARRQTDGGLAGEVRLAGASNPAVVRGFESVPREDAEFGAALDYTGDRFAVRLEGRYVSSPEDGDSMRPDGSYVGVHVGNLMLSAGYMEKWWGPGHAGSLILSTNARPIPSLTIERHYSDPFESKWLAWIGPWRASFQAGRLESDRNDYPNAHFMALRVTFRPVRGLEVGLSRTAQLCGDGRACTFGTYWDMIIGNDNDQSLEEQPGNQLAGFDARWSLSPLAPVAVYGQAIGEDEAGFLPGKYLALGGLETWWAAAEWSWRAYAEWSGTSCDALGTPLYGCAYESGIYTDGYRYRGRAIGHTWDRDGDGWTFGLIGVRDGWTMSARVRDVRLNRLGEGAAHSLTPVGGRLRGGEAVASTETRLGQIRASVGYADMAGPGSTPEDGVSGFLEWRHEF
jgi:Capsule assembly protein Wzi